MLAKLSTLGSLEKHPLDPNVLMEMKPFQFPMESPTEFEIKWSKYVGPHFPVDIHMIIIQFPSLIYYNNEFANAPPTKEV